MNHTFLNAVKNRRSIYGISDEKILDDNDLVKIIKESVKHTPTAFNSQTGRVIVLLHEQHHKLWDITKAILQEIVPVDRFSKTNDKIEGFKGGYGTILFFEDQAVIKQYQDDFSLYKDKFPTWSQQSSGMLQYIIWTALEESGYGANLQHYNPLIDETVKQHFNIPDEWKLVAQMPFGKPTAKPKEKSFEPLHDRIKVIK